MVKLTLSPFEMEIARKRLGREPNEAEWATIDALWSEHCSYKSSKVYLRSFPSSGERVVMGIEDWQDAGALDVGDGWAIVLKLESHNHPSAIDPFNGSATGVGGIIRDIISKGAIPIALLDMIRVGNLNRERNRWLLKNIIRGIGFYGNSIGVPVVGGELSFDDTYDDNPLVDVAGIGVVRKDKIVPSVVKQAGLKIVIVGLTGLDGLGGASFASRKLSGENEIGAVQIADPFAGKIVLDVTLSIADKVEAIKDLGGGGLVVGVTEMANGFGAVVDLDRVPLRVSDLTPEEILISETQERMLFAVKEERVKEICAEFEYYEYPCAEIGYFTDDSVIRFRYRGKEIVNLPSELLVSPPLFMWEVRKHKRPSIERPKIDIEEAIRKVVSHPDFVSKEWAYSQFDYEVGTSTVIKPGEADAAVIALPNGKLLAVKGDANPDLCENDAYECGKYIVAEAYRNLATVGAKGIGIVDHLQFGDPRKPEVYYTFVEALRGIAEAAKFFNTPVVGGKVSFYNENKEGKAIKPTPLVVMAGLVEDKLLRGSIEEDLSIVMLGLARDEMRGTFLSKLYGNFGETPKVRLNEDLVASELVVQGINRGKILFAKDIGRGGLVSALFSILVRGYGVDIRSNGIKADIGDDLLVKLFSESTGRFIVLTKEPEWFLENKKGVIASVIGKVTKSSGVLKIDDKSLELSKEIDNYYNYFFRVIEND
ncbi:phosphoribosylformylglycinamidine synthase subunit PurL [Stygiolobus caldivivus]|uniref:Phosphoribosylformylglycinamidine synthase subunit PurL n=1 Tax=Stygiolobus caldivivus TaxID=2824673 RepID=A0A8D5U8X2_9CREN|nr:phosphoribosylformylglycinamidine synthase subunit PurL [Stygiolobus caldivivus]BCU71397.1 phosphoribosylformylglycinamidine synthase [Stygiolobus caldivivus]